MNNRQAVKAAGQRRQCWPERQPDDPGHKVKFLTPLHLVRYPDRDMPPTDDPIPRKTFAYLEREFRVLIDGVTYTVPAGFATDLASIPRRLRGIVSLDRGVEAAVVHDWLYRTGEVSRAAADLIFKRLLEQTESPATVWLMYLSVRAGGRFSYSPAS